MGCWVDYPPLDCFPSLSSLLFDLFHNSLHDFIDGHSGRVDRDRVIGLTQRRVLALPVAPVALLHLRDRLFQSDPFAIAFELGETPSRALFGSSRQKNLDLGAGKNDRADIAALRDNAAARAAARPFSRAPASAPILSTPTGSARASGSRPPRRGRQELLSAGPRPREARYSSRRARPEARPRFPDRCRRAPP